MSHQCFSLSLSLKVNKVFLKKKLKKKKNSNLFLIVWEAESPRSGRQHDWVLVRALFQAAEGHLLVSSQGGRGEASLQGLFHKSTHSIYEDSILRTKDSPPNTITLGIRISTHEFQGNEHSDHNIDHEGIYGLISSNGPGLGELSLTPSLIEQ